MLENRIVGNQERYVRSDADSKNRQKCIFAQSYSAIFVIALTVIVWVWNPSPAHAVTEYVCYALADNGNRITSAFVGSYIAGRATFNKRPATLALVRDFCHDSGTGYYYNIWNRTGTTILATRAFTITYPDGADFDYTDHIQSWDMSQVANRLGCSAASGNQLRFPGINQVIALLPQSPSNMRIPTLINKMAGENSLAGNLAIELYSGVWQFLGILTSFKLFKVFFKGG